MKFKGLDGRRYGISIESYEVNVSGGNRSIGQDKLGYFLASLFKNFKLYEEFPCVPLNLRLDFFIPALNIAFEFDGKQHDEYVAHFHKDRYGFARSKRNDAMKKQWCETNGITLIRIKEKDLKLEILEKIIHDATG
jgi:very-short-patch-repair endonuclease